MDRRFRMICKIEMVLPSNCSPKDITPYVHPSGRKVIVELKNQDALFNDRQVADKNYGHIYSEEKLLAEFTTSKQSIPNNGKGLKQKQEIILPFKCERTFYTDGPYSTGWVVHYIEHLDEDLKEKSIVRATCICM